MKCFECKNGVYSTVNRDETNISIIDRKEYTAYNVEFWVCNECHDTIIGSKGIKLVDRVREMTDDRFALIVSILKERNLFLALYLIRLHTGCGLADAKKYMQQLEALSI